MVTDRAVAAGTGSISREDGGGDKQEHGVDGGEVPSFIPAPASGLGCYPRTESYSENKILDNKGIPVDLATKRALQELTLHGHPVTIAKCKFQAHIARVNTAAEARAVSEAVSAQIQCEAAFSEFVCPFAYRLACLRGPDPRVGNDRSPAVAPDTEEEEGFCDNGDIGSGEKLLYLLQKWDVRHRVLVVTRINGGFMMAELLGIRRYKFVIDRGKRLLESSDLASLRRAVAVDMNPPSTTAENDKNLAIYEAAAAGGRQYPPQRHCRPGDGGIAGEDGWDLFVVPLSARRRVSAHDRSGIAAGAPQDSGSGIVPRQTKFYGSLGRGKLQSAVIGDGLPRVDSQQEAGWGDGGSTRTRERQALLLAQLSISSKTVAFPPGHVPSVMGAKGQGKKRGRINHFAVRTPPSTSGGCGQSSAMEDSCGVDRNNDSDASTSDQRRIGLTPGWNLPHELDPTSGTTGLGGGRGMSTAVTRRGGNRVREVSRSTFESAQDSSSAVLASRSSCRTINSPGRISAIMLGMVPGVSNDHPLHPPPPDAAAENCQFRGNNGAPRLPATSSDGVVRSHGGTSDDSSSFRGSLRYRHQPPPSTNAPASHADGARARASLLRSLVGGGGGGGGHACADAGHVAPFSGIIDDQDFTGNGAGSCRPAGGTGGSVGRGDYDNSNNNNNAGLPLPLLRGTPGTGVREQPWDVAGGALEPSASVGGWNQDSDDPSISTLGSGDVEGEQARVPAVDDSLGKILRAGEGEPREKQCESPAWSSGDPASQGGTPSGDPRAPPSSSMSGIRGWSVGRTVTVSQPLVTELGTAPSPGGYTVSPR